MMGKQSGQIQMVIFDIDSMISEDHLLRRIKKKLLKKGRLSAGKIAEQFPVTAASVSGHLSVLKEGDLILDTREGKHVHYDLNAMVLEEVMLWIAHLKGDDKA